VLFLDEPTTGLDPRSRDQLWVAVRELAADGVTVLLTTQYLAEAEQLADHVALLHQGRIAAEGTADELMSSVGATSLDEVFLALTAAPGNLGAENPGAGGLASVNDLMAGRASARATATATAAADRNSEGTR
jgi:ABC-2 type transport system ATP-binding protein